MGQGEPKGSPQGGGVPPGGSGGWAEIINGVAINNPTKNKVRRNFMVVQSNSYTTKVVFFPKLQCSA
jgi:hypothetical protein